ncbi:hypothetical protein OESDEN_19735 [Oesophagostomum dentatum]|uniref:Amidinotransferase n=1 Tax=Oesophagostomum dentatum TaxID=61180 RepID=A0A0B1S5G1_OESDE|nr:hypothetical protein OESDEN_19735 [Oesophagostomum dentatum]
MYFPGAFTEIGRNNLGNFLELIPVPEEDAKKFACNAVVIGKNVILNVGCNTIAKELEKRGFKVHFCDMSEYLKSGGSCKCLTLRLDYDWYTKH